MEDVRISTHEAMRLPRKRLLNKSLPRRLAAPTSISELVRPALFLMYEHAAMILYPAYRRPHVRHLLEADAPWHASYQSHIKLQRCCTIRHAFSGNEFFITREILIELNSLRHLYRYVREHMQLPKNISLVLFFADCRTYRSWKRHEVRCTDCRIMGYVDGAILETVVHP